jgi:hypothetical protein
MQSEARSTDLLYAAGQRFGYIFSYPAGRFERSFKLHIAGQKAYANGLCSDSSGNVFITVYSASYTKILEYAHEGTKPIAELGVPQPTAVACASDPTSGNLAVTTSFPTEGLESVAIFADARGKPKIYYGIPKMSVYAFCAYDDGGDLFVDGERNNARFALGELSRGSQGFTAITVKGLDTRHPGNLQWVGKYLSVAVPRDHKVYLMQISGTTGTIVDTIVLDGWNTQATPQSLIRGDKVVAPAGPTDKKVALWEYPQGGKPIKVLSGFAADSRIAGVAVSVTPGR